MRISEPCDLLIKALIAARPRFPRIAKNSKVKVHTKTGGEYEYEYATLDSILDVVVPILGEEGLVPLFGVEYAESGEMEVSVRIAHSSGQWVETGIRVGHPSDLKEIGGAITYGKRYALQAILGVQADEDLDADPPQTTKAPKARTPSTSLRDPVSTPPPAPQGTNVNPPATQGRAESKRAPESQSGHPSRPQLSRLFALKTKHVVSDEALKLKLLQYGVESTKDLSLEQYQTVCDWIEAQEDVPAPASEEQWAALKEEAAAAGTPEQGTLG